MHNTGNLKYNEEFPINGNFLSDGIFGLGISSELLREISELPIVDESWVFCDFDDTLFSREEQLKNPLLRDNRGYTGNKIIIEHLGGYENFVKQYYYPEGLTSGIVDIIRNNISFILSAGDIELQELKIEEVGLYDIPRIIVPENSDKPLAILETILKEQKIPSTIVILDDRVKYFCQYGQFLSELLGSKIIVKEVKLNGTQYNITSEHCWNYK